ncbi:MAG TPA: glycosyltransferase [Candidatus Binataceae bacterium]
MSIQKNEHTHGDDAVKAGRRLRVVHLGKFYPPYVGGIETHIQALCGELRKSLDVRVIVANDHGPSEEGVVDGVNVSRLRTQCSIAGAPLCASMAWRIRKARADVVHLHLPNPFGIISYLMSGHRGPLVATWHSDVVRQELLATAFEPFLQRFLKHCLVLIASSPNYIESSRVLSAVRERCRVIPYGIAADRFKARDPAAIDSIRARYGPKIVLTVGRLVYYKGVEYLIDAMAKIDGCLLVVGDGPLRASLERRARAIGVADRVAFIGEVSDCNLASYYQACDVFVLPSVARSEAFGIVQLEAMACGKPVINTSLASGVPFASLDGVTGVTVPPGSPAPLADALTLLLDDENLRAKYGRAALSRVESEFSLDAMVRRTIEVYEKISGRGRIVTGSDQVDKRSREATAGEADLETGTEG